MSLAVTRESAPDESWLVERVDWDAFLANDFVWQQGEHITLLGPTGVGKTTLALRVLPYRRYVVVFGTKPRDATLSYLHKEQGYKVIQEWPPPPTYERVILWPSVRKVTDLPNQRRVFTQALADIYESGSWCVYMDEIRYLTGYLKLERLAELLWQQGRSVAISIVGGTQRPAWIPLAAYDQATHLFLWKDSDRRNLKRLMEISGTVNIRALTRQVQTLGHHEVLYVNTRLGQMLVTEVNL